MASLGSKGFWHKLAMDLTSLRVSTIVSGTIHGGQINPEPVIMLVEIATTYDAYVNGVKKATLSNTERDILSRIRTSCAEIGRLYATLDQRARQSEIQGDEFVTKYKELKGGKTPDTGVDRNKFSEIETKIRDILDIKIADPVPTVTADWTGPLLPSTWKIKPEDLAKSENPQESAPQTPAQGDEALSYSALYQGACRTIFQFEPDEVLLIRKIWEMGTDVVLMETVIQIDGDVITRIRDGCQGDPQLLSLHNQFIQVALNNWRFLADALGKLVIDVLQQLFPARAKK